MFIQLRRGGEPLHEVVEPRDMLLACHGRIRMITALASKLSRTLQAPADEVAAAAQRVERFYAIGVPLHAEDEDRSLMPRLLLNADAELDSALMQMTTQHPLIEELSEGLCDVARRLSAEPGRFREMRPALAARVLDLESIWTPHLDLEERVIFPRIATLADEARRLLAGEMRARRARPGAMDAIRAAVA